METVINYIGPLLLSICAIPLAVESIRSGNGRGISTMFLWLWFFGEILTIPQSVNKLGWVDPITLNYLVNFVCLCITLRYKYWERK